MQGEFIGLKMLILQENECVYYVHCFAHQLQLALVAVTKKHIHLSDFFALVSNIVNVIGASCKSRDTLREKQATKIIEALSKGYVASGRGLNQETNVVRPCDTHWGSHYGTLLSLVIMFSTVIDVLDVIVEDATSSEQKLEVFRLLKEMQSFEFVFNLHLMKSTLGITNKLSQTLQRKDQDIVNAMKQVQVSKQRLQSMRDNGWSTLVDEVSAFCGKNDIDVPDMEGIYVSQGRSRRRTQETTISHHYRVQLLYTFIDMQLQELNNHFNEVNTELLFCVACLNPSNSFASFDKERLNRFAEFYPKDFSDIELLALSDQLENFVIDVYSSVEFSSLTWIGNLAKKTQRDIVYPLVYKLLKLALILPVAIATMESIFSNEDCEEPIS